VTRDARLVWLASALLDGADSDAAIVAACCAEFGCKPPTARRDLHIVREALERGPHRRELARVLTPRAA
jgi:hypothetical protein